MKRIIFPALLLAIFSFAFCQNVLAAGIISQPIVIENAMRGQVVEDRLQLLNSKDEEISFGLSAEGDIADWVTYYTVGGVEKLISEVSALAKDWAYAGTLIKIPDDTPNGEYKGSLVAFYKPNKQENKDKISVTIAQKFTRKVTITVTDTEIVKLKASVMPVRYVIAPNKPLQIKLIYTNQGNIAVRPQAQIKIFTEDEEEIFDAIYPYPKKEAAVKPLKAKEIIVPYNTGELPEGRYRAGAVITLNGEKIHEDSFNFTIRTENADTDNFNRFLNFISRIGGGNLVLGWFIIGGFFIMLSMMLTFAGRKRGFWERIKGRLGN